jgi:hypothetical protein
VNRLVHLLEALILLSLASCYMFGPADGGFRVSGSIRDSRGQLPDKCSLELRTKEDKLFFGPVSTKSGQFSTQFLVAPYKADYWLIISCPGYESQRISVRYGENTSLAKALNLGEIVMKRER